MQRKSIDNANQNRQEELQIIANQLQKQMKRILKPYNKDLKMYLQCAEYPDWAKSVPALPELNQPEKGRRLFEEDEINSFLTEGKMLPLEKFVILCSIMERCLLLSFSGGLTAHIPLQFTGQNEDFMDQLRMNIYFVLAVLDNEFNHAHCKHQGEFESDPTDRVESVDLSSLPAVIEAASYRGFRVSLAIQKRRAA